MHRSWCSEPCGDINQMMCGLIIGVANLVVISTGWFDLSDLIYVWFVRTATFRLLDARGTDCNLRPSPPESADSTRGFVPEHSSPGIDPHLACS
jgi:hypothetical protein